MPDNKIELPGIFSEGYGVVPKRLMKAKDINSNTKLILCYLLSHTGAGITCFPSMDNMKENLNISKRTIVRCISEAVDAGYLSKTKNRLGRGKGTYNIYNLEFMADFAGDKIARAKIASANTDNAGDKNDTMLVTPGNYNNISSNNNNKNNNKALHAEIKAYFTSTTPDYFHDGKHASAISNIISRAGGDRDKIFSIFEKHLSIKQTAKEEFWRNSPHTPASIRSKWDSIIAYKSAALSTVESRIERAKQIDEE